MTRTNVLLAPRIYTNEDFTLVDNKARYNFLPLREFLKEKSDPNNPQSRISMHAHKLHFYQSGAKELRDYFSEFLNGKLKELNKIVDAAGKNVSKYNEIVKISNNNLTRAWLDRLASINGLRDETKSKIQAPWEIPPKLSESAGVIRKQSEIRSEISHLAQSMAHLVKSRVRLEIDSALREQIDAAKERISKTRLEELTANSHDLEPISISIRLAGLELIPRSHLQRLRVSLRQSYVEAFGLASNDLRQKVDASQTMLRQRAPLANCEAEIKAAKEALQTDLERFFQNVELYRDGVFSHRTKESIATLGIGRQLDDLESGFDDADKSRFGLQAVDEMFPGYEIHTNVAVERFVNLEQCFDKLQASTELLKSPGIFSGDGDKDIGDEGVADTFVAECSTRVQIELDQLVANLSSALSSVLTDSRMSFVAAMSQAGKQRKWRYISMVAASGLIGVAAYAAYYFFKNPVEQTLLATLGWGVLSNVIGDMIGLGVAKFRDDFPQNTRQIRERFRTKLREDVRKKIDEDVTNFQFASINEALLGNRLSGIYDAFLKEDPLQWYSMAEARLSSLRAIASEYQVMRGEYHALTEEICNGCGRYFSDPTSNLDVLNSVAALIKSYAIEPSFKLLEGTSMQLADVRASVVAIKFS